MDDGTEFEPDDITSAVLPPNDNRGPNGQDDETRRQKMHETGLAQIDAAMKREPGANVVDFKASA